MESAVCHMTMPQQHQLHQNQQTYIQQLQQLAIDGEILERWRRIGSTQGLSSDSEIANFLIQHYENTWERPQPIVFCVNCHLPLTLSCLKCKPAAHQTNLIISESVSGHMFGSHSQLISHAKPSTSKRRNIKVEKELIEPKHEETAHTLQDNDEDLMGLCIQFEHPGSHAEPRLIPFFRSKAKSKSSGIKSFLCTMCGKTFFKSSDLKKHIRIHTREKPYICQLCPAAFSDPSSFSRHKRVHTGEKPFVCGDCKAAFAQSSDLTKHRRIHTREKPICCQFCSAAFSDPSSHARHRRKHFKITVR